MRPASLAAWVAAGILVFSGDRPQAARVDDVLARMRAAMGGDALLSAVQTLRIDGSEGSWSATGGGGASMSMQVRIALPDQFLRVTTQDASAGPMGSITLTNAHGFSGTNLVGRVVSSTGTELPAYPEVMATAPADRPSALARAYNDERRRMLTWTLVLLGAANPAPGFTVGAVHDETLAGRPVHVADLTFGDGLTGQLTIDATTSLPSRLSWKEPARSETTFTMSTESRVTVRGGQVTSSTPASPPSLVGPVSKPAASGEVEFVLTVDQFKTDRGVTWPRRWSTTRDGKRSREIKVGKYELNPKFGKDAFTGR